MPIYIEKYIERKYKKTKNKLTSSYKYDSIHPQRGILL